MHRVCSSLQNAGYDVILLGREKKDSLEIREKKFKQIRINCWFERGKLFYLEFNFRLFWFLLFSKVEIIIAVDLDTLTAAFCATKLKRAKLVFDAHEYFEEVPEVVDRPLIKWVWGHVAKTLIPGTDAVYTVNRSLAQIFSAKYKKEFVVIRNVPVLKQEIPLKKNERYIIYQGALNEGRGIEELLRAMVNVELPLKLVGEGDLSEELRELCSKSGLEKKVSFLGKIAPEDLRTLTKNAYIGLNLLLDKGLNYRLSLANKFFDYMHAGIPSVSMNFPEYQQINQMHEVSVLIENLDPAIISDAINSLIADLAHYEILVSNCAVASEIYCWQNEEKKLLDICNLL